MPGPSFCFDAQSPHAGPASYSWRSTCSSGTKAAPTTSSRRDAFTRQRVHRLKKLAAELGLAPGSFEIRSNKAGIAVSGEVTLHHDRAYIQVGQFGLSSGHGILIRTCKGRKDYTGGPNHFVALTMLDDIPALAAAVRAITGVGREDSSASQFRAA